MLHPCHWYDFHLPVICPPVIEPDIEQIKKANTSINDLEAAVVPADGSSSGVCSAGLAVFA